MTILVNGEQSTVPHQTNIYDIVCTVSAAPPPQGIAVAVHLVLFQEFAPDPSRVVLDGFQGTLLVSSVRFDDKKKFTTDSEVRIQVSGESRNRETIDVLRNTIVENDGYRLRSTGAETTGGKRLDVPFAFQLRSNATAPVGDAVDDPQLYYTPCSSEIFPQNCFNND